jgi:hypothetical protein
MGMQSAATFLAKVLCRSVLAVWQNSPILPSVILHKVVVIVGPISPTCSRMTLSKTTVRGRVKPLFNSVKKLAKDSGPRSGFDKI